MRKLVRIVFILPMIVVVSPLMYIIAWAMRGHDAAIMYIRGSIEDVYTGWN